MKDVKEINMKTNLICILVFISCNGSTVKHDNSQYNLKANEAAKISNNSKIDSLIEDSIVISKIFELEEVKARNIEIELRTRNKHGVSMMIRQRPSGNDSFYLIQVGYSSKIRFEVYYNFYYYQANDKIAFLDVITNKQISIGEWRKRNAQGANQH